MIFTVATHSFLLRVSVDEQWRLRDLSVLDTGHHYGTALLQDGGWLAVKRVGENRTVPLLGFFDAAGARTGDCDAGPLGDVHQMAHANGGVYIADTAHNRVVFRPLSGAPREEYMLGDVPTDVNHLNSVYPCGPQLFALLHNLGRGDGELVVLRHQPGSGFAPEGRVRLWHRGIHNVFVDGQHLFYNASPDGRFVSVSLRDQRVARSVALGGHNKGLAVVGDAFVVGVSEHAPGSRRFTSRGGLAVLDRTTLAVRATIDLNADFLPHPVGNVNEVRCVSGADLGHAGPAPFDLPWSDLRMASDDRVHQVRSRLLGWARRARRSLRTAAGAARGV